MQAILNFKNKLSHRSDEAVPFTTVVANALLLLLWAAAIPFTMWLGALAGF